MSQKKLKGQVASFFLPRSSARKRSQGLKGETNPGCQRISVTEYHFIKRGAHVQLDDKNLVTKTW